MEKRMPTPKIVAINDYETIPFKAGAVFPKKSEYNYEEKKEQGDIIKCFLREFFNKTEGNKICVNVNNCLKCFEKADYCRRKNSNYELAEICSKIICDIHEIKKTVILTA